MKRAKESLSSDRHGVAEGLYDNLAGDLFLVCLCGDEFRGRNWEEAGAGLDEHIWMETKSRGRM